MRCSNAASNESPLRTSRWKSKSNASALAKSGIRLSITPAATAEE
jgi:hypothetical protein